MNETLQKALTELVEKSMEGMNSTVNFLQAEIPEVLKQLLMWHGVSNFIYFILGIFMAICLIILDVIIIRKGIKDRWDDELWMIAAIGGTTLNVIIATISSIFINMQWLQIWIAPKVWLIEYASKLIK